MKRRRTGEGHVQAVGMGTVSSFCAKIPCSTPPTNIHLSEQVFLHCYDKCVCIMKVGVKWPHSDPCVAFVSCLLSSGYF